MAHILFIQFFGSKYGSPIAITVLEIIVTLKVVLCNKYWAPSSISSGHYPMVASASLEQKSNYITITKSFGNPYALLYHSA